MIFHPCEKRFPAGTVVGGQTELIFYETPNAINVVKVESFAVTHMLYGAAPDRGIATAIRRPFLPDANNESLRVLVQSDCSNEVPNRIKECRLL